MPTLNARITAATATYFLCKPQFPFCAAECPSECPVTHVQQSLSWLFWPPAPAIYKTTLTHRDEPDEMQAAL